MINSLCLLRSAALKVGLFLLVMGVPAQATDFFVAPDGQATSKGSRVKPWDLATALGQPPGLKPGDTIWMRGGTYRGGFTSMLQGGKDTPITVRALPGERATVDCKPRDVKDDGLFTVKGAWTHFWGLEFTCSDPQRVTREKGSWPEDIRRGGINSLGSHIKFINLIVHDTAGGFGFWGNDRDGEGGEIYGCLVYHNGWNGPDRGHGHGIYAQNARGIKRIVDNVLFNQFSHGIHCYGSEKAFLQGFHIEGNAIFNNGSLSGPNERTLDLLVGGGTAIDRLTVLNNYIYGSGLRLGYASDVRNRGIVVSANYVVGGARFTAPDEITFTGNTLIAPGTLLSFDFPEESKTRPYQWDNNTYIRSKVEWAPFNAFQNGQTVGLSFPEWKSKIGGDVHSSYLEAAATGVKTVIRPNRYEKGRAHLIVYNWDRKATVPVDLKGVLQTGQQYRVVSAQNFYGEPVLRGTYDGRPLRLPMGPAKPVQPVGMPDYKLPVTGPGFGVFVVLPMDQSVRQFSRLGEEAALLVRGHGAPVHPEGPVQVHRGGQAEEEIPYALADNRRQAPLPRRLHKLGSADVFLDGPFFIPSGLGRKTRFPRGHGQGREVDGRLAGKRLRCGLFHPAGRPDGRRVFQALLSRSVCGRQLQSHHPCRPRRAHLSGCAA